MSPNSALSLFLHTLCMVPAKCPQEQCILDFTHSHILCHFSVLATQIYIQGFTIVSPPNFVFLYPVHVKSIASSFCVYGGGGPSFPCQSPAASYIYKGPASTMLRKLKTKMEYTFYWQFTFTISLAVFKIVKTVCSYQNGLFMCRIFNFTYHSCFAMHTVLNIACHS